MITRELQQGILPVSDCALQAWSFGDWLSPTTFLESLLVRAITPDPENSSKNSGRSASVDGSRS
jgi:hypothetical protein